MQHEVSPDQLVRAAPAAQESQTSTQAASLRAQADRCRRLAATVGDRRTSEILVRMADEYESQIRAQAVN